MFVSSLFEQQHTVHHISILSAPDLSLHIESHIASAGHCEHGVDAAARCLRKAKFEVCVNRCVNTALQRFEVRVSRVVVVRTARRIFHLNVIVQVGADEDIELGLSVQRDGEMVEALNCKMYVRAMGDRTDCVRIRRTCTVPVHGVCFPMKLYGISIDVEPAH